MLGPKPNLDHRSFFSLGWYVNEFFQIISFFERNSGVRLSLELNCVIVIKQVALCEINNGIHIYQLPLNFYFTLLFPDVVVVSDLNKNIGTSTDLAKNSH